MASPSRTTTRGTPRTSRALAGMPRRCAAPTSAIAASGAGQVISRAADRPGSLSVPRREERTAPDRREVGAGPGRELVGEPANRPAALVEQPGLTGERLAALDDPDGVVAAVAGARSLHVHEFGTHAVELHEVAGDAPREDVGVELGLDGDAVRDRVQTAGEAKERRQLRDASRRARIAHGRQFSLDVSGQRHGSPRESGAHGAARERSSLLVDAAHAYSRPRSRCFTRTATPGSAR